MQLIEISNSVRNAIVSRKSETRLLKTFPYECCRDASILLGIYLKVAYCHKELDDFSSSHGWLEVDGFIIDITADQFDENAKPVTIIPNFTGLPIYQNKKSEPCRVGIVSTDGLNLLNDYNLIVDCINGAS